MFKIIKLKIVKICSLFYVSILVGCNISGDCEKVYINKNQYNWFNNIEISDTLVFRSQNDSIMKYRLDLDSSFTVCNKLEVGPNTYQTIELKYILINESNEQPISLTLFKDINTKKTNWCHKHLRVFELSDYIESDSDPKSDIIKINLRDSTSLMVYYFEDFSKESNFVENYCWNRENGLVRFNTYQGEVYELVSR